MYARKKGKSSSSKPIDKSNPKWVSYKPKEAEAIVLKLVKEDNNTAMVGTILRDTYGIPSIKALTGKTMSEILRENDQYPEMPEQMRRNFDATSILISISPWCL